MAHLSNEVCGNCGLSFGAHSAGEYHSEFYKMYIPNNCCPGHEGRMDWGEGPGTVFKPTGTFTPIDWHAPASKGESNDLST